MVRRLLLAWLAFLPVLPVLPGLTGSARAEPEDQPTTWLAGDHLTGDWGGRRTRLADHGLALDLVYATEVFVAHGHAEALGHIDAAITLDTEKLGWWKGGTFYVLGQNSHGTGINTQVGSAQAVSNLEADPYTQLTELFFEQTLGGDKLRIRVGKQDANRDFGTPRFGGNFINNNFGMFPNSPLPSYPTTGLGAVIAVQPVAWLVAKAGIYEGSPGVGGFGLTTAFRDGAGYTLVTGAAATHHTGPADRDGGTTSLGVWRQAGEFTEPIAVDPHRYETDAGFFVQHDERIFAHPRDPADPSGLTLILRFSWARPDRNEISRYAGGSAAWHGIGARRNDTVGLGGGYFTIAQPIGGAPGPGDELFAEAFYKLRLTSFVSVQPDVEVYRRPGGDGRDALLFGARFKAKL